MNSPEPIRRFGPVVAAAAILAAAAAALAVQAWREIERRKP